MYTFSRDYSERTRRGNTVASYRRLWISIREDSGRQGELGRRGESEDQASRVFEGDHSEVSIPTPLGAELIYRFNRMRPM